MVSGIRLNRSLLFLTDFGVSTFSSGDVRARVTLDSDELPACEVTCVVSAGVDTSLSLSLLEEESLSESLSLSLDDASFVALIFLTAGASTFDFLDTGLASDSESESELLSESLLESELDSLEDSALRLREGLTACRGSGAGGASSSLSEESEEELESELELLSSFMIATVVVVVTVLSPETTV